MAASAFGAAALVAMDGPPSSVLAFERMKAFFGASDQKHLKPLPKIAKAPPSAAPPAPNAQPSASTGALDLLAGSGSAAGAESWHLASVNRSFPLRAEVTSLGITADGCYIVAGCSDGSVHAFDMSTGKTFFLGQIYAKGLHTSLQLTIAVTEDGRLVFAGVQRGATELLAFDLAQLPSWAGAGSDALPVATLRNLVRRHTHSDAKLKGFGAASRLARSGPPEYRLFCGRGIKNIHVWRFLPPEDPASDAPPIWECLYDAQSNGNTVEFGGFLSGGYLAFSKSNGQGIRLWAVGDDVMEEGTAGTPAAGALRKPPYRDVPRSADAKGVFGGLAVGGTTELSLVRTMPLETDEDDPFTRIRARMAANLASSDESPPPADALGLYPLARAVVCPERKPRASVNGGASDGSTRRSSMNSRRSSDNESEDAGSGDNDNDNDNGVGSDDGGDSDDDDDDDDDDGDGRDCDPVNRVIGLRVEIPLPDDAASSSAASPSSSSSSSSSSSASSAAAAAAAAARKRSRVFREVKSVVGTRDGKHIMAMSADGQAYYFSPLAPSSCPVRLLSLPALPPALAQCSPEDRSEAMHLARVGRGLGMVILLRAAWSTRDRSGVLTIAPLRGVIPEQEPAMVVDAVGERASWMRGWSNWWGRHYSEPSAIVCASRPERSSQERSESFASDGGNSSAGDDDEDARAHLHGSLEDLDAGYGAPQLKRRGSSVRGLGRQASADACAWAGTSEAPSAALASTVTTPGRRAGPAAGRSKKQRVRSRFSRTSSGESDSSSAGDSSDDGGNKASSDSDSDSASASSSESDVSNYSGKKRSMAPTAAAAAAATPLRTPVRARTQATTPSTDRPDVTPVVGVSLQPASATPASLRRQGSSASIASPSTAAAPRTPRKVAATPTLAQSPSSLVPPLTPPKPRRQLSDASTSPDMQQQPQRRVDDGFSASPPRRAAATPSSTLGVALAPPAAAPRRRTPQQPGSGARAAQQQLLSQQAQQAQQAQQQARALARQQQQAQQQVQLQAQLQTLLHQIDPSFKVHPTMTCSLADVVQGVEPAVDEFLAATQPRRSVLPQLAAHEWVKASGRLREAVASTDSAHAEETRAFAEEIARIIGLPGSDALLRVSARLRLGLASEPMQCFEEPARSQWSPLVAAVAVAAAASARSEAREAQRSRTKRGLGARRKAAKMASDDSEQQSDEADAEQDDEDVRAEMEMRCAEWGEFRDSAAWEVTNARARHLHFLAQRAESKMLDATARSAFVGGARSVGAAESLAGVRRFAAASEAIAIAGMAAWDDLAVVAAMAVAVDV